MLSKEASSTIYRVFGVTRPGIEPRSPWPLSEHSNHHTKHISTNNSSVGYNIIFELVKLIVLRSLVMKIWFPFTFPDFNLPLSYNKQKSSECNIAGWTQKVKLLFETSGYFILHTHTHTHTHTHIYIYIYIYIYMCVCVCVCVLR